MPRRELESGTQVASWLQDLAQRISRPAKMILIGSGALLWHAADRGMNARLPEASMDVDPITDSDEVAAICYECLIGSEFEREHGWHVNLMPETVLNELPTGWRDRAAVRQFGHLELIVPHPEDLLAPKLKRGEPRDIKHYEWAKEIGLL